MDHIHVAICTPSIGFMKSRYTASLLRMFFYYQTTPIVGQETKSRFLSYHMIEGSMIGAAREEFVRDVLALPQATHLLFIDEDMGFREDTLNLMLSRQVPIASCNYRMKVPPCAFTCRKLDDSDWLETTEEKNSLEEASWSGFGFCLIEREVLEKMKSPMFQNVYVEKYKTYSTEDRSFFLQAAEYGYTPFVDHQASKKVYHIGNYAYSYDDDFPAYKRQPKAERMRTRPANDADTATAAE